MKKKWEYLIADLVSLGLLEYGLFVALAWYWSKFQWSPFGYETCGLEFLGVLLITYPAFIIGLLIRLGLLSRWKVPHWAWRVRRLPRLYLRSFPSSLRRGICRGSSTLILN